MNTGQTNKYFILFSRYLTVLFCLVSITACVKNSIKKSEVNNRNVLARVNGKPIYEDQLTANLQKGLRKFRKYGMNKNTDALTNRLKKKTLMKVIERELIYQESQKLKIENVEEKVELLLQKKRDKLQTEERFEKYLQMKKTTVDELREAYRKKVYVNKYFKEQGISNTEVSEDLIRKFYDSNPESYHREASIKASHILINTVDAVPEEKEKAREEAEQIRKEILAGADFAKMAINYSDCNSASGGGGLGYIRKGYMPEEFEKVAFALETDAVSPVVKSKFGYHIIKVVEKVPEGNTPFEEVKDFIRKYFEGEESKKKLTELKEELKKKAKIEIYLD